MSHGTWVVMTGLLGPPHQSDEGQSHAHHEGWWGRVFPRRGQQREKLQPLILSNISTH